MHAFMSVNVRVNWKNCISFISKYYHMYKSQVCHIWNISVANECFSKWSIQKPVYWIQHNSFSMVGITANQKNLLHFTLKFRNREQKREIPLAPITYVLTPSQMICHIIEYLHINYWILSLYYLNVVWITVFFIHWKGGNQL